MRPTPEQLSEWLAAALKAHPNGRVALIAGHVAHQAYAAGADDELEECVELTLDSGWINTKRLREERRPAPPTPQQKALKELEHNRQFLRHEAYEVIRQGLEAAHQFTPLSKPNYIMNPTDTEIEKLFRQWWAESFPNNPPGTHALRTHLGWARHLLNELNKSK